MDNWSWIEVVWTLTAVVGMFFSFRNIRLGLQDSQVLDKETEKGLRWELLHLIARGNTRRDALRFAAQFIWAAMGVIAGNIPTQNPAGLTVFAILIGLAFTFPSAMFTISAIGDYNDRVESIRIGKILEAQEQDVI